MGEMKFNMPNDFGIYLHDVPDFERDLFKKDDRWISNGCIRVEDAHRLAKWLFGDVPHPSGTPEENVDIPDPVPVYVTYLTAGADADGPKFRRDPYDRDLSDLVGELAVPGLAEVVEGLLELEVGGADAGGRGGLLSVEWRLAGEHRSGDAEENSIPDSNRALSDLDGLNRDHLDAHLRSVTVYALYFPVIEVLTTVAMATSPSTA